MRQAFDNWSSLQGKIVAMTPSHQICCLHPARHLVPTSNRSNYGSDESEVDVADVALGGRAVCM